MTSILLASLQLSVLFRFSKNPCALNASSTFVRIQRRTVSQDLSPDYIGYGGCHPTEVKLHHYLQSRMLPRGTGNVDTMRRRRVLRDALEQSFRDFVAIARAL